MEKQWKEDAELKGLDRAAKWEKALEMGSNSKFLEDLMACTELRTSAESAELVAAPYEDLGEAWAPVISSDDAASGP